MSKIKQNSRYWSQLANGWRKWADVLLPPRRPLHKLMVQMARPKKNARILDVGTGIGEPGLLAIKLFPSCEVVGCDISSRMLQVARQRARQQARKNFKTVLMDGKHLPFEAGAFDTVLCCSGLEFMIEPEKMSREMARVTKVGGTISAASWGPRTKNPYPLLSSQTLQKKITISFGLEGCRGYFQKSKELEQILSGAGFSKFTRKTFKGHFQWDSPDQLFKMKMDLSPPAKEAWQKSTRTERAKIRDEFENSCRPFMNRAGRIKVPIFIWVVAGTKAAKS